MSKRAIAILVVGLLAVATLVAVLASGFGHDPRALPSAMVDKPAPAFDLMTLDGERVSLEDLRGRKIVLNFWSTWCQPCKLEHPVLNQIAARQGPDGAVFLGALYDPSEPDQARTYLKRHGNEYPILFDPTGRIVVNYGVGGVPETFFISTEGIIAYKWSGALDGRTLLTLLERTP